MSRAYTGTFILLVLTLSGCSKDGSQAKIPDRVVADPKQALVIREELLKSVSSSGDEGGASSVAGPEGFATLKGAFVMNGGLPELRQLTIDKDVTVCSPDGKPVFDQDIKVDSATNGIANVLIYLDKVPEAWWHESAAAPSSEEVVFDQKNCVFLTRVVAMHVSQRLKVLNSDPVGHNLKVKNFNEGIAPGGVTYFSTSKPDAIPQKMSCSVHPWMTAWFIARENMYFAVSKEDGTFEIPNVPAGVKLTAKIWHERTNLVNGDVGLNGETTKLKKGKLDLELAPDETHELNFTLDSSMF